MENNKFEILKTASEYIVNLKIGINKAIKCYQEGQENRGGNLIVSIAEGIQWLSEAICLTSDIQIYPIYFQTMNEKLNEVVKAFENGDYTLIGDLFEYEILPIIDDIEEKIKESIQ